MARWPSLVPALLLSLFLFIFVSTFLCAGPIQVEHIPEEYWQILRFMGAKEYDKAIALGEEVILKSPSFDRAYKKVAEAYAAKKQSDGAVIYFQNLMGRDPQNACAYYGLGTIYNEKGEQQKAIDYFKKSIELFPLRSCGTNVFRRLVHAYGAWNKLEDAIKYLEDLVEKNPRHDGAYYGLGYVHIHLLREATEKGLNALNRAIELNPEILEAYKLRGDYYAGMGWDAVGWDKTYLPDYMKALALAEKRNDVENQAELLKYLSDGHANMGDYSDAFENYQRALKIYEEIDDPRGEINVLNGIGGAYARQGHSTNAIPYFERSLRLSQEIGDRAAEATTLIKMAGRVYFDHGDHVKSLDFYERALKMGQEIGNRTLEAESVWGIASAYDELVADYPKALAYYQRHLELMRETRNRHGEGWALQKIGRTYRRLNDYAKAMEYYQSAWQTFREIRDPNGESWILNNIGMVNFWLANYSQALSYFRRALKIAQEIKYQYREHQLYHNMGSVYVKTGEYAKALEYYQRALQILRAFNDRHGEGKMVSNIAYVYVAMADYEKAIEYSRRALDIILQFKDKRWEGDTLRTLGMIYKERAEYAKALDHLQKALKLQQDMRDKHKESETLNILGNVYLDLGDYAEAIRYHELAREIAEEISYVEFVWRSDFGMAHALERQNKLDEALDYYKSAVEVIDSLRGQQQLAEDKIVLLQNKIDVFKSLCRILLVLHRRDASRGYDKEAFHYVERAKARALLEILEESKAGAKIIGGIDTELLKSERELQTKIASAQKRLDAARLRAQREEVRKWEQEKDRLYEEYRSLVLELRQKNPKYADLKYPDPAKLEEVQNLLSEDALLLEYFLNRDHSFLFAIARNEYRLLVLPGQEEIEKWVDRLRKTIADFRSPSAYKGYAEPAYTLYSILIKPAEELLPGKRRLIISADGYLHYLPFEALLTGATKTKSAGDFGRWPYVIRKYDVSYIPSASVLRQLQAHGKSSARQKELLVFADPIYPGERVNAGKRLAAWRKPGAAEEADYLVRSAFSGERGPEALTRLAYSSREALDIAAILGRATSDLFLREQATEDKIKHGVKLDSYRIVHFAAHALVNENKPQFSAIALTRNEASAEDGYLQMYEVFNLNLNADLVVLSACKSGLGKRVEGEGLIGLARAFLYAGAARLVVSLWDVQDRATAEFMKNFYRHLKSGRSKAEALRLAKLDMTNSPRPLWRHPFYWAPFVLVGNSN